MSETVVVRPCETCRHRAGERWFDNCWLCAICAEWRWLDLRVEVYL